MTDAYFAEILLDAHKQLHSEFDNAPEHKFSLRHRRGMKKLFKQNGTACSEKCEHKIRISKKLIYAAVIIVTAVLLGITAIAVATGGFRFDSKAEYTKVLSEGWENAPYTYEYFYMVDAPDGFQLTEYNPDFASSKYQSGEEYFIFSQSVKRDYNATYNTEGYTIEELLINDRKAFFISWEDTSVIVCDNGDYILRIIGTLSKEQMVDLLKTAKIKK